jgi:N-acyl-D-aspartate/D-glutamate deacylase
MKSQGLSVWSQGFTFRKPLEIMPMHYNNWDAIPIFRTLSAAQSREDKIALVRSKDYRDRFEREYDPDRMAEVGGELEIYLLIDAAGSQTFQPFEGQAIASVAKSLGRSVPMTFLDMLEESQMNVLFVKPIPDASFAKVVAEIARHPRVLAGISDGGAHSKHGNGGFWSTDMIRLLTLESSEMTLEEVHNVLGFRNAEAACLTGRGSLQLGNFADIMIYDWKKLNYDPPLRYQTLSDLPGGDWRKVKRAIGIKNIIVNGDITFENGEPTGATPGRMVASDARHVRSAVAAE